MNGPSGGGWRGQATESDASTMVDGTTVRRITSAVTCLEAHFTGYCGAAPSPNVVLSSLTSHSPTTADMNTGW